MAAEISVSVRLRVNKGNVSFDRNPAEFTVDMTGTNMTWQVQAIGTSAENVYVGTDIGTAGWSLWHNTEDAGGNFVELGYDDGGFKTLAKLEPGEYAAFRLNQNAPQAKADTASVDLEYIIVEA